jgi:ribosomal protein L16 Arg81 hydroxylase
MEIQTLFGDVPVATFVDEYLHRLPFAIAGSAKSACELGTWQAFGALLEHGGEDIFATRAGQWYSGPRPTDLDAAQALLDEQYTLFVRHAERHQMKLAELAQSFESTFKGPVNIHVFATPAGAPGFSWHYDAEDVFILQTQAEKEYSLRKNTVNPWPLEETLPADMHYERELMPLLRVLLRPGDLLYIPCGYWHKADALPSGETAISLAVGVMSRSALHVYEFLRDRLAQSLVWRQRLPLTNPSERSRVELEATYRHVFKQLADDLARTLADPELVTDFLTTFASEKPHEAQNILTEEARP